MECNKCGKNNLTEQDFYKANNKKGRESECRDCSNYRHYERRRQRRIEKGLKVNFPTVAARFLREEGKKYCPNCKEVKDIKTEFSTTKARTGIAPHCKVCSNVLGKLRPSRQPEIRRQKYQRDRSKIREYRLKKKFGISIAKYNDMYEQQNGVCAICKNTQKGKSLAVDHNHVTGEVRALLCNNCNAAVGFVQENPVIALAMAEYLTVQNNRVFTY